MIIDGIVYDGIDEMDVVGPLEVLRNAERLGGVTSGIDLALWLVQREVSAECAATMATRMEYAWVSPAPPVAEAAPATDRSLGPARTPCSSIMGPAGFQPSGVSCARSATR